VRPTSAVPASLLASSAATASPLVGSGSAVPVQATPESDDLMIVKRRKRRRDTEEGAVGADA
jgi:hypothetical protein